MINRIKKFFKKEIPIVNHSIGTPFFNNTGVDKLNISENYKMWVYACSSVIAENVSEIKLELKRKIGKREITIEDHKVLDLLNNPNQYWSPYEMFGMTSGCLNIYGEAFWQKIYEGMRVSELIPLYPSNISIKSNADGIFEGYEYRTRGRIVVLQPEEVIHFKKPNPVDFFRALGVVEAAAEVIQSDNYASQFHLNSFMNRAIPNGVIESDHALSQREANDMQNAWNMKLQGVKNASKVAVLAEGAKFRPIQQSVKDLETLDSRKYNEETIQRIFGVSGDFRKRIRK